MIFKASNVMQIKVLETFEINQNKYPLLKIAIDSKIKNLNGN